MDCHICNERWQTRLGTTTELLCMVTPSTHRRNYRPVKYWLYRQNLGKNIDQLNIIAVARDWNKRERQRRGGDYPVSAITVVEIPVWSYEEQTKFIEERVSLHQDSELSALLNDELPLCSDEERWKKEDTYRVMKKGRNNGR